MAHQPSRRGAIGCGRRCRALYREGRQPPLQGIEALQAGQHLQGVVAGDATHEHHNRCAAPEDGSHRCTGSSWTCFFPGVSLVQAPLFIYCPVSFSTCNKNE